MFGTFCSQQVGYHTSVKQFINKQAEVKFISGSILDIPPASASNNFWFFWLVALIGVSHFEKRIFFCPAPMCWLSSGKRQMWLRKAAAGNQRGDGTEKGRVRSSIMSTELGIACTLPPHGPAPAGKGDVLISISFFLCCAKPT